MFNYNFCQTIWSNTLCKKALFLSTWKVQSRLLQKNIIAFKEFDVFLHLLQMSNWIFVLNDVHSTWSCILWCRFLLPARCWPQWRFQALTLFSSIVSNRSLRTQNSSIQSLLPARCQCTCKLTISVAILFM